MPTHAPHTVADLQTLTALFGPVGEASLRKEVTYLHPVYQQWIQASPFAVLATSGPHGLDASPRGDPASLVTIHDEYTLLLPERRGNNRIDSLRNILRDPRISLMFFVAGSNNVIRVNGRAVVTADDDLRESFTREGKLPRTVIVIEVAEVYSQCARALLRSGIWVRGDQSTGLPTVGDMLAELTRGRIDGATYDAEWPGRAAGTMW